MSNIVARVKFKNSFIHLYSILRPFPHLQEGSGARLILHCHQSTWYNQQEEEILQTMALIFPSSNRALVTLSISCY